MVESTYQSGWVEKYCKTYAAHSVIMNIKLSSGEIRYYRYVYLGQAVVQDTDKV